MMILAFWTGIFIGVVCGYAAFALMNNKLSSLTNREKTIEGNLKPWHSNQAID